MRGLSRARDRGRCHRNPEDPAATRGTGVALSFWVPRPGALAEELSSEGYEVSGRSACCGTAAPPSASLPGVAGWRASRDISALPELDEGARPRAPPREHADFHSGGPDRADHRCPGPALRPRDPRRGCSRGRCGAASEGLCRWSRDELGDERRGAASAERPRTDDPLRNRGSAGAEPPFADPHSWSGLSDRVAQEGQRRVPRRGPDRPARASGG